MKTQVQPYEDGHMSEDAEALEFWRDGDGHPFDEADKALCHDMMVHTARRILWAK